MEKWWNEICGRGKWEKPREKPTQTPFRPQRNPHGGTEKRTRDPSGGRRASNCLHNLIYDSLKFQTCVTDVQSFMRPYVNFYAIEIHYKECFPH